MRTTILSPLSKNSQGGFLLSLLALVAAPSACASSVSGGDGSTNGGNIGDARGSSAGSGDGGSAVGGSSGGSGGTVPLCAVDFPCYVTGLNYECINGGTGYQPYASTDCHATCGPGPCTGGGCAPQGSPVMCPEGTHCVARLHNPTSQACEPTNAGAPDSGQDADSGGAGGTDTSSVVSICIVDFPCSILGIDYRCINDGTGYQPYATTDCHATCGPGPCTGGGCAAQGSPVMCPEGTRCVDKNGGLASHACESTDGGAAGDSAADEAADSSPDSGKD